MNILYLWLFQGSKIVEFLEALRFAVVVNHACFAAWDQHIIMVFNEVHEHIVTSVF